MTPTEVTSLAVFFLGSAMVVTYCCCPIRQTSRQYTQPLLYRLFSRFWKSQQQQPQQPSLTQDEDPIVIHVAPPSLKNTSVPQDPQ